MITHLMVHELRDGEISMFDFPADIVYTFNPGQPTETSPDEALVPRRLYEGGFWQTNSRGCRVVVPIGIDISIQSLNEQVEGWLSMVHMDNADVPGTLIIVIRSRVHIPQEGSFFEGGFAFVPASMGVGLGGSCPIETIRRVLATTDVDLPYQEPLVQDILRTFLNPLRTSEILEHEFKTHCFREKETRALERARRLLYEQLTLEQIADLEESGSFHVEGADQKVYLIETKHAHNVYLLNENGHKVIEFCLVFQSATPIYDLLLAQKMLLESNPGVFYAEANRWKIQSDGSRTPVYMAPRNQRPFLNLWPELLEGAA